MQNTVDSFVKHARFCLTIPTIYLWGTIGQFLTCELIESVRQQYPNEYSESEWQNFKKKADGRLRAFDCSGLIKNFLMGGIDGYKYNPDTDYNSAGLLSHAPLSGDIDTLPEMPGICLYMEGHVGIYDGKDMVIECTSNPKYGSCVTKTKLSERSWEKWFFCPGIDYSRS